MTRVPSIERGCTKKINIGRCYVTHSERLAYKHGKRFGVYHCPHCGGYHMTSKVEGSEVYGGLLYITRFPK